MDLKKYLADRKELVELALAQALMDNGMPSVLRESMEYSLQAGGKRLRSILTIAGAEAVGGKVQEVMSIGCAIEMIHTFSLIP